MFLLPSASRKESKSSLFIVLLELEKTNILFNEIAFKLPFLLCNQLFETESVAKTIAFPPLTPIYFYLKPAILQATAILM